MLADKKPLLGITMGDPAGIGPEIIAKALMDRGIYEQCKPLVIGDKDTLRQALPFCGGHPVIHPVDRPEGGRFTFGTLDVLHTPVPGFDAGGITPGKVQAEAGKAAYEYIKEACRLAMAGKIDAIVTAPISKEAIRAAGIPAIGHTEIFGELTGTPNPLTMFQVGKLRVFFLSRHVSLRKACDLVTEDNVYRCILQCQTAMEQLGMAEGTLAVAGLNPHNGEHGMFGDEETTQIVPAVLRANREGLRCTGPIPADSVFSQALQGKFAAVLSLYHDQGHVATKTLDFERTISVTLGLPFIRTSVDHGTAFDIAGYGIASPVSMKEAIRIAEGYLRK